MTVTLTLIGALAAGGVTGCGSKRATTTPADPAGDAAYGGDTYGASEPTGEPRPDPDGGDPCGY
ncbi:MAG: hypothetical protein IPL61_14460 [Myxococcales bacterium]|nr:hypothetical protein [Myxococcales bacterium]